MLHTSVTSVRTLIYASLYRPVLFLGVEQTIAILEATLIFALLVGIGPTILTVVLALVIVGIIHPVMAALTTRDPLVSRVYLRTLAAQDYYPARPPLTGRLLAVHPAIPVVG